MNFHTFAAYSEIDLNKWQSAIESIISNPAAAIGQTTLPPTQTRDSVFSGNRSEDDVLGPIQGRPPEPLPVHDSDEGNLSDCTIYEDIDELVQEFDKTMQVQYCVYWSDHTHFTIHVYISL